MIELFIIFKTILYTNLIKVDDNRVIIVLLTSLITLSLIYAILSLKTNKKYFVVFLFYTVFSIILFANAVYFSYFNTLLSINVLSQARQLNTVKNSIKHLLDFSKIILLLDIPFVYYYLNKKEKVFKGKGALKSEDYKNIFKTSSVFVLSILIYLFGIGELKSVINQEFYSHQAVDFYNIVKSDRKSLAEEQTIEDGLKQIEKRMKNEGQNYHGIGKGKNLIVIQVESLANFVMFRDYDGQEITPNLNKLASSPHSLYYNNYFQLIGKGNTSDAEFVSLNSLYPSMEKPTYFQYADNKFYGLPWLMRDNGYTAWAFHGYKRDFWNRDEAYINQGFERFIAEDNFNFTEEIGFGITDKDFFNQSMFYLNQLDQKDENPFFAFLVTLTSHNPYEMPEEYQKINIKEEHKDSLTANYLQSIHYTDEAIAEFIQNLKDNGLYDDSVIVIYGDHFAINAGLETEEEILNYLLGRPYDYDMMMNIPLIIHVPNENLGETITTVGSQLDFYPTIANIMGYENTKGITFGMDLNNPIRENYVFPQTYLYKGSFISQDYMFQFSRDGVYENSKVINRFTRREEDINKFMDVTSRGIREIDLSDYILKNNYFMEYIK